MRYHPLILLIITFLFFHTLPASKPDKSENKPDITKQQLRQNLQLINSLSTVFGSRQLNTPSAYVLDLLDTVEIPFIFPLLDSYDLNFSTELAGKIEADPQSIFGIFIQIIYSLIRFQIKRLFQLKHFEPLVPFPKRYRKGGKSLETEDQFFALLNAILPGATLNTVTFDEPFQVNQMNVKLFQPLNNDSLLKYSTSKRENSMMSLKPFDQNVIEMLTYSLPSSLLNKNLPPGYTILTKIGITKSYPPCREVLEYMLKGMDFKFVLKGADIGVVIKPNDEAPSVKEGKEMLDHLLKTPIWTPLVVPEVIENAVLENKIPKTSCYHPSKLSSVSPYIYERMLTIMIIDGLDQCLQVFSDINATNIIFFLKLWLQRFLPNCSLENFTTYEGAKNFPICAYDPSSLSMSLFQVERTDGTIAVAYLKLGEPVALNHIQMGDIGQNVFPFPLKVSKVQNADTPVKRLFNTLIQKLNQPIEMEITEERSEKNASNLKFINNLRKISEWHELSQLIKTAFYLGTVWNTNNDPYQMPPADLVTSDPHLGAYCTVSKIFDETVESYHVTAPLLYPMPAGQIFAVSLKTGQILRNRATAMLVGVEKRDKKTICYIRYFDTGLRLEAQNFYETNEILEAFPAY